MMRRFLAPVRRRGIAEPSHAVDGLPPAGVTTAVGTKHCRRLVSVRE